MEFRCPVVWDEVLLVVVGKRIVRHTSEKIIERCSRRRKDEKSGEVCCCFIHKKF
jgi:hypothetical protein